MDLEDPYSFNTLKKKNPIDRWTNVFWCTEVYMYIYHIQKYCGDFRKHEMLRIKYVLWQGI